MRTQTNQGQRISGLDTLRFIAALWVVFSHCGYFPLTKGLDRSSTIALLVQGVYGNLFAGVPAVIVFFVISGFCIHYPYRVPNTFELLPYLARRYLRIGIPLAAAILLARPFQVNLAVFHNSILWTLVAELIYYSLYPILRRLKQRFGWDKIIAISYLLAYAAVLIYPTAKDYSPYGTALNWLVAFPCWLLGCRLAEESSDSGGSESPRLRVWQWRFGIWFLSWLCSVLRFHSPVGYPWTLNIFAIAVFCWLQVEIKVFHAQQSTRLLEWAGQWSYSIYLTHLIANEAFGRISTSNLGDVLNWIEKMLFILAFSYGFYLLFEKPGHFIARLVSKLLRKRTDCREAPHSPDATSPAHVTAPAPASEGTLREP